MQPRVITQLGLADMVTIANAGLGFFAAVVASQNLILAARLILLAAITDALDGVIARHRGGTAVGEYLDGLADVASFGVAPALIVATVSVRSFVSGSASAAIGIVCGAAFVMAAVTRLGLYTAYDSKSAETEGVQTTLAATIIGASLLAGFMTPSLLVILTGVLTVLMLTPITYPDLHAQDSIVMGAVQIAAIGLTGPLGRRHVGALGEGFAFGLLFLSLAYLTLGPRFYWRRD